MSFYTFFSLNHYVSFHLKNSLFFLSIFLNLNSGLASSTIFMFKIFMYYFFIRKKQISIIWQSFNCKHIFYKSNTTKFTHNRFVIFYSKYIVSNWFIFESIAFLSINNETQCVPLLFLSSKLLTYGPFLI